jgi:hypothetical protein
MFHYISYICFGSNIILQNTKLSTDEFCQLEMKYINAINTGEYDDEFSKYDSIHKTLIFTILKEKFETGESRTEKELLKKKKKQKKIEETQRKKDEAKHAALEAEEQLTIEDKIQREEQEASETTQLTIKAKDIEPFAFFNDAQVAALQLKFDVIWVRESNKLTPARIAMYESLLHENGM